MKIRVSSFPINVILNQGETWTHLEAGNDEHGQQPPLKHEEDVRRPKKKLNVRNLDRFCVDLFFYYDLVSGSWLRLVAVWIPPLGSHALYRRLVGPPMTSRGLGFQQSKCLTHEMPAIILSYFSLYSFYGYDGIPFID